MCKNIDGADISKSQLLWQLCTLGPWVSDWSPLLEDIWTQWVIWLDIWSKRGKYKKIRRQEGCFAQMFGWWYESVTWCKICLFTMTLLWETYIYFCSLRQTDRRTGRLWKRKGNEYWRMNKKDNLQLAMLRGQVCSSKGKRARNMGQEQIKDTLQRWSKWGRGENEKYEKYDTWGWIWCTFAATPASS